MKTKIIITLLLLLHAFSGNAQDKFNINGNYTNTPMEEVFLDMERQSGSPFYFDKTWTDSLTVSISLQNETLKNALNKLLRGTSLNYFIYRNNVIITHNAIILADLANGFFGNSVINSTENKKTEYIFSKEYSEQNKGVAGEESTLIKIGGKTNLLKEGTSTIGGYIKDRNTGEPIVGAVIYTTDQAMQRISDPLGFYSITLPNGKHLLKFQFAGMKPTQRNIVLFSDGKLDVFLDEDIRLLNEVTVQSDKNKNIEGLAMGLNQLDIKSMKRIPGILGEVDVMRLSLTLPGVQTVGEGASGFNVRGGKTDQNLILLNEATIYNSSHFFGFFSVFNPGVIKDMELYKSGIPAEHGGRLSSIFSVKMRDGNKEKFSGQGSLGPVTASLALEGPIFNDKTTIVVGARTTYSDWVLDLAPESALKNSSASFYDLSGKISHTLNDKNLLELSGYYSKDKFGLTADSLIQYANKLGSAQWTHSFNKNLNSVVSATYSKYEYKLTDSRPENASDFSFDIEEKALKAHFSFYPNKINSLTFGGSAKHYSLSPGQLRPLGPNSLVLEKTIQQEAGLENALYLSDDIAVTPDLSFYIGLRYSFFTALGPGMAYQYSNESPKEQNTTIDSTAYKENEAIKTYHGPEYRISARYAFSPSASVKASYNRTRQYLHMISNTTAISPLDTWKLSSNNVRPQIGDQYSLGLYKNLKNGQIETSMEVYYKDLQDILDYKDGAHLLLNERLETDILQGVGKAYGAELMVKKPDGKLNGWISYTYSRTFLKMDGRFKSEKINKGAYFPANYDKPHDFTLISNYKASKRFSFSANLTYSTGRPITYPVAKYNFGGAERVHYSDRNQYRIPDYFRIDLGINIEGNHKVKKLAHSFVTLSVYNVTGRNNIYSIFFLEENGEIQGYKLSIFGAPIPTISYNFKF